MIDQVDKYLEEVNSYDINNREQLEDFRLRYLSKKGLINVLFEEFKNVTANKKKDFGKKINILKVNANEKYQSSKEVLETTNESLNLDLTLSGEPAKIGTRHPVSIIRNEIVNIFERLGFTVSEGPEIEDDWHVFSALNFPLEHPARDMQDTFFIGKTPDILLRTHTSSVQVRVMEKTQPPIRMIMPGRVFRNEAISARSHCMFHQVEGLFIDKKVSFADLKQTLLFFAKEMFGAETKIRLRPSFFPFTEPSAEMDISCNCNGKGCNLCKGTGWLEILGCGMVDPSVLENCGINSSEYSGFAFGMGIERIALLKYQVKDIRIYFENDVRFLNQFKSSL